jgi:fructokinase
MTSSIPLLCLGEALIDVVAHDGTTTEHVGGSLLNVACGLARLGHDSTIQAWYGRDERGGRLRDWTLASGAKIAPGTQDAARTPVAYAEVDAAGRATYTFDIAWQVPTPPDAAAYGHLHTGSIAATLEPGGAQVVDAARRVREHGTTSYDPNIRPALMGSPAEVRGRVEELIGLADVVKASDEDLAWLYGDEPLERTLRRLKALGPALVVITRGPWGAIAALAGDDDALHLDQINVTVGDTVGAGDSFMAGLLSGLADADLLGSRAAASRLGGAKWSDVQPALHRAVATSAITVSRKGAYGPDQAEVAHLLANRPAFDDE